MNIYATLWTLEMHGDYLQVLTGLARRGHKVTLFVQEPPRPPACEVASLRVIYIKKPYLRKLFGLHTVSPFNLISLKAISLVRQQGSGVFYVTGTMLAEGLIAGILTNTPILCDIRSPWSTQLGDLSTVVSLRSQIGRRLRFFRWRLEEKLVKRAAQVVAYSEELKNWLVKRVGVEASRIMVIPPHIDTERFRPDIDGTPIREKYSIGNAPLLMYVGSMNYKRGIDLLVEATFRIRAQFPAVKLMLVGPWPKYLYPYRTEVENQIKNSGLQEHIIMTDLVAWEDIPSYMASADILVSALRYTHTYTMPPMQKLPEYLAACKPIVVTSVGLTDYIKHETNALVVEPGSVDALAGAIVRLLKYPGLARSLAQEGRSLVAKSYNVERMVDAFESSLLSCIGNPEKG